MFHSDRFDKSCTNPFNKVDADKEKLNGDLDLTNGCTRIPLKVAKYIYENYDTGLYTEIYEQKDFKDYSKVAQSDAINAYAKKIKQAKSNEEIRELETDLKEMYGEEILKKIETKAVWGKDVESTIQKPYTE